MSRRNISQKRFPQPDSLYNSYLVNLLISRVLKSGKKTLAQRIVYEAFEIIQNQTKENPLLVFEKAVRKASPLVEVKALRKKGNVRKIPIEISGFRSTNLALQWILKYSKQRIGQTMATKLAYEIIDTANNISNTIKKKEETHKTAKANRAFAHFKY